MQWSGVSKALLIAGVILIVMGLLWQFVGQHLPLGRLPGDIRVEKENYRVYFPIATSLLLSLILSFLFWLFRR